MSDGTKQCMDLSGIRSPTPPPPPPPPPLRPTSTMSEATLRNIRPPPPEETLASVASPTPSSALSIAPVSIVARCNTAVDPSAPTQGGVYGMSAPKRRRVAPRPHAAFGQPGMPPPPPPPPRGGVAAPAVGSRMMQTPGGVPVFWENAPAPQPMRYAQAGVQQRYPGAPGHGVPQGRMAPTPFPRAPVRPPGAPAQVRLGVPQPRRLPGAPPAPPQQPPPGPYAAAPGRRQVSQVPGRPQSMPLCMPAHGPPSQPQRMNMRMVHPPPHAPGRPAGQLQPSVRGRMMQTPGVPHRAQPGISSRHVQPRPIPRRVHQPPHLASIRPPSGPAPAPTPATGKASSAEEAAHGQQLLLLTQSRSPANGGPLATFSAAAPTTSSYSNTTKSNGISASSYNDFRNMLLPSPGASSSSSSRIDMSFGGSPQQTLEMLADLITYHLAQPLGVPPPVRANHAPPKTIEDLAAQLAQLPSFYPLRASVRQRQRQKVELKHTTQGPVGVMLRVPVGVTHGTVIGLPEHQTFDPATHFGMTGTLVGGAPSGQKRGIKRKKTTIACNQCSKAKAACDLGRPCIRCTRLGKESCVDRDAIPQTAAAEQAAPAHTQARALAAAREHEEKRQLLEEMRQMLQTPHAQAAQHRGTYASQNPSSSASYGDRNQHAGSQGTTNNRGKNCNTSFGNHRCAGQQPQQMPQPSHYPHGQANASPFGPNAFGATPMPTGAGRSPFGMPAPQSSTGNRPPSRTLGFIPPPPPAQ